METKFIPDPTKLKNLQAEADRAYLKADRLMKAAESEPFGSKAFMLAEQAEQDLLAAEQRLSDYREGKLVESESDAISAEGVIGIAALDMLAEGKVTTSQAEIF